MRVLAAAALVAALSGYAQAGPYGDELSKCLVESTTAADRVDLVKWMFTAAAAHPAVKPLASVSNEVLDDANKRMGALLMRLMTETCRAPAEKAVRFEGAQTIEAGFQLLGQVAGKELFASPEVSAALSRMDSYIDMEKLKSLGTSE